MILTIFNISALLFWTSMTPHGLKQRLAGAQKAALDMQGKNGKSTNNAANASTSNVSTAATPAQKAAAALAQASLKAQQSSVLAMLGQGTHVNTWG